MNTNQNAEAARAAIIALNPQGNDNFTAEEMADYAIESGIAFFKKEYAGTPMDDYTAAAVAILEKYGF